MDSEASEPDTTEPPRTAWSGYGFVQREIDRLSRALTEEPAMTDRYAQIYAARQALSWALEPQGFAAPYDMIIRTAQR